MSDDNFNQLLDFVRQHKNELMIDPAFDIVKLVGLSEDDYDYYYIVYGKNGKTKISCVGKLIPLKGVLNDKDYNILINQWELNPHIWSYEKVYDENTMKKYSSIDREIDL